jgi:hypothetical protein
MLNELEYNIMRARLDRLESWRKSLGRNWHYPAEVPNDCKLTNTELSAIEVYEFVNIPPKRYTAYINITDKSGMTRFQAAAGMLDSFTTWTGDYLGSLNVWKKSRDGRGNKVWYVVAHGINGVSYYGRHYPDSGDIVHLTANKHQK